MVKRCKVFISYSHEDEVLKDSKVKKDAGYPRAFLSRLYAAIAAHDDLLTKDEIFFDDDRLAAEPAWRPAINTALDECGLLIFLVSPHSVVSEFCLTKELARAFQRGVDVITVLLRPSHDWYRVKVRNPATGESKALGEWHSGGVPKIGGNAEPVSKWTSEDDAWEEVCKAIVKFMKDNPFGEPGDVQLAPAHEGSAVAINADPLQVDERDITRNAQLLRRHLHKAWRYLDRNPTFIEDSLFSDLAKPLMVEAIMARVVDKRTSAANLVKVGRALGRVWDKPESSAAREAFLRILPVVVDSFIAHKKGAAQLAAHQPIWVRDALTSAVLAAQQQNFGLALKGSQREPESVFPAIPPAFELAMPGEHGCSLVNREAMRVVERLRIGTPGKIDHETVKATVDEMRKGFDVAMRVDAVGDYEDPMRRQQLCEYLQTCGIYTFFIAAEEQDLPPDEWIDFPIGSLETAFRAAFPVSNPASGRGASGATGVWLPIHRGLERLTSAIWQCPDLAPRCDRLVGEVRTITEYINTALEEADAPEVKRCLDKLEIGLQNLSAQDPLRETLNSIRDGLKAVWPDLLKLMS